MAMSRTAPRPTPTSPFSRLRARVLRMRKSAFSSRRAVVVVCVLLLNLAFFLALSGTRDPFAAAGLGSTRAEDAAPEAGAPAAGAPAYSPSLPPRAFAGVDPAEMSILQADVREVTRVMYRAYMNRCMGKDEYVPVSDSCEDWFNIGLTVLDSLDTLVLMRLDEEYRASRDWAAKHLSFERVGKRVSMFEINIRAVGGLNSAYELTGDKLWLNKSVELADGLLLAFNYTKTGCPPTSVYIGERARRVTARDHDVYSSNPAEAGTLQLEFRTLSRMTGDRKYAAAVDRCMGSLLEAVSRDPLATERFSLNSGGFEGNRVGMGAMIDSFYEMMVKTWVAFGKRDETLRIAYERGVEATFAKLVRKDHDYAYVGEYRRGNLLSFRHEMEHLTCFFPGTLAYGALHGLGGGVNGSRSTDYIPRARELTKSCYAMSRGMFHGLAAEVTDFSGKVPKPKGGVDNNQLRPEIVEALYYMDKVDPKAGRQYKYWGEQMWKALREYAQVPRKERGIFSTTYNLLANGKDGLYHAGKLHSFAIAETFKYFFLLFDERRPGDSPFPLDRWVYNTEAHPVRVLQSR